MKVSLKIYCCSMIFCHVLSASGDMTPKQTGGGTSTFFFRDNPIYAKPGATSATAYVGMSPGDSSWTGSTGYSTSDGTGVAGQDYTPVSGSFYFWGPEWKTFGVPINPGPVEKTVLLHVTGATATLIIPAAPPPLTVGCETNGLCLTWDARYTNYVVETATNNISGPWISVGGAPAQSNGLCTLKIPTPQSAGFFRLHKQ